MPASFLFYDLETFGADPRTSRVAQFAAIRTDADLNQIEDPISVFVQPADDLLPSPVATLITGIAPQQALREGMSEAAAFALIFDEMSRPETCTPGYNSLRFDDEFVRYGLFRNFYDAYEREWRGGNSRWDLLDVLRLAHALRPDGLWWPQREDGATSFKLEHLAEANGVREGDAHEALSDVRALIGLARKLKAAQPRLWDYALRLRDKRYRRQPARRGRDDAGAARLAAVPGEPDVLGRVLPVARHPRIDSRVIAFDLDQDPDALLRLSADDRRPLVHAVRRPARGRTAHRPQGNPPQPLPGLIAWDHLRGPDFERLRIDPVGNGRVAPP